MKASFVVGDAPQYLENRLFHIDSDPHSDNLLSHLHWLRSELQRFGIDLSTSDLQPPETSELVFFLDRPRFLPPKRPGQRYFLYLIESFAVRRDNEDLSDFTPYDRVFSWDDRLSGQPQFTKIQYSIDLENRGFVLRRDRPRFMNIICRNKGSSHPLELYSERKRLIEYYSQEFPDSLDLFGEGWSELRLRGKGSVPAWWNRKHRLRARLLWLARKLGLEKVLFEPVYPVYRGTVERKVPTMANYRFSVCYENIRDIPGYITEKILHAFLAGSIPIYWGANNVLDYIPSGCFLDRRDFGTDAEMHQVLLAMTAEELETRRHAIFEFLSSPHGQAFSDRHFADTVTSVVVDQVGGALE